MQYTYARHSFVRSSELLWRLPTFNTGIAFVSPVVQHRDSSRAMTTLCRQDLADILNGSAVLGSGGGGQMQEAQDFLAAALATNNPIVLQQLDKAPPQEMICIPFVMGDMSEDSNVINPNPHHELPPILNALRLMENHVGRTVSGVVPAEIGASNVALAFYVAAVLNNGFVVDADPVGRSIPELGNCPLSLVDLPSTPVAASNSLGEKFLIEGAADDKRLEDVLRNLCVLSNNEICGVDHAMTVEQLRPGLISGTVSKAWAIGRCLREAKEVGVDVASAIATKCGGRVLFRGHIRSVSRTEEAGFCSGEVQINGSDSFEGKMYRTQFKNETMAGWLDNKLSVSIPEVIALVSIEEGLSVPNPNLEIGMLVAVVVLPAPEPFSTRKGLQIFGPKYLGFNGPFRSALGS